MSEHPELSIIDTAELAELRGHAREIKRLQHQVAQQRYALDMAQRERDKTGRAVNEGLRKERDDARAELARRNIQIGDRDETIFNLNRTLLESERQVVELRRQRDDFGTQCAQHRDSLDAKARQIGRLSAVAEDSRLQQVNLNAKIYKLEHIRAIKDRQIESLSRQIYDLEQQVDGNTPSHTLVMNPMPDGSYNLRIKKETR